MKKLNQDLSSFMAILIMTIGCLIVLLISNVVIIISNPDNKSLPHVKLQDDGANEELAQAMMLYPYGNRIKTPHYVELDEEHMILHPQGTVVARADLETADNPFEQLIDHLADNRQEAYMVLLLRPKTGYWARSLKKAVMSRGIDLGIDLVDAGEDVVVSLPPK